MSGASFCASWLSITEIFSKYLTASNAVYPNRPQRSACSPSIRNFFRNAFSASVTENDSPTGSRNTVRSGKDIVQTSPFTSKLASGHSAI